MSWEPPKRSHPTREKYVKFDRNALVEVMGEIGRDFSLFWLVVFQIQKEKDPINYKIMEKVLCVSQ